MIIHLFFVLKDKKNQYTLIGDMMINKKNIWFLTLFSLVLALSVYYVTMPSETLLDVYSNVDNKKSEEDVVIEETDVIAVHHLEEENSVSKELDLLKMKLVDAKTTIEEKNDAYDSIRDIKNRKILEANLENQIKKDLNYKSFVKIEFDKIIVVVSAKKYDISLANKIMKLVQKNFDETKYITVKFE